MKKHRLSYGFYIGLWTVNQI